MLNGSGERGHICLVADLRRSFIIKCDVSCGFFTDALFGLRKFPSTPSLLSVFNDERALNFV